MTTKTINVNELQSKISKVLKDVQDGDVYEVMKYSEPFAVVLSYEHYLQLKGECHRCVLELRQVAEMVKKGTLRRGIEQSSHRSSGRIGDSK